MINSNFSEKMRQTRLMKKITLKALAKECGLSYSYISQVERGEASPSLSALDRLAKALGVTVWQLLKEESEDNASLPFNSGRENNQKSSSNNTTLETSQNKKGTRRSKLIRKDMRRSILLPKSNIRYQMITPDLNSQIQMLLVEAEPGISSGDVPFEHEGEVCMFVLSGRMETEVGDEKFILEEGDSLYFSGEIPHSWNNIGEEKFIFLVTVTPPAY